MTTIVGGICPRCGQFHDLFLAVDGSIVCRNADGVAERIRQLEADRDAVRAEVAEEIAQAIERKHADAMTQYRMERSTYWEGSTDAYDTAARIARQIGGAA